ncbi:hypothetical protein B0T16DRAFT_402690 [Cercophora newfieldiana]|uniref:Uncharacterized protein n=1 Tax=Cercophora newfieldiana TaxID=92897 RepID=A0AA39YSP0_9PEZI|nr:hypothetical protein B0T16DRAFT_402690 [Cercophora newfieldiana]
MSWEGHMRLPPGAMRESPIPAKFIEERVRDLRRGAAEHIIPQATAGSLPEMRCFDPNKCACLDFGSRYPSSSLWAGFQFPLPRRNLACCLGDTRHRLLPLARLVNLGKQQQRDNKLKDLLKVHWAVSQLSSTFGDESGYSIRIGTCPVPGASTQCLQVDYVRRVACGPVWQPRWRTVDYSWFEALDPDSYGLSKDRETRGVLWCLDPDCVNFYRYLERPLFRKCCGPAVAEIFNDGGAKGPVSWSINRTRFDVGAAAGQGGAGIIVAEQARLERARLSANAVRYPPSAVPVPGSWRGDGAVNGASLVTGTAANAEPASPAGRSNANPARKPARTSKSVLPRSRKEQLEPMEFWRRCGRKLRNVFSTPRQRLARMSAAEATRMKWAGKKF